jgi:cyclohexanone monooxygenase
MTASAFTHHDVVIVGTSFAGSGWRSSSGPRVRTASARYDDDLQAQLAGSVWSSGCSSWYLDDKGKNRTLWPGFTFRFRQATGEFNAEDYQLEAVA